MKKVKCLVIRRLENGKFIGGYTQALGDGAVFLEEIADAQIGTQWEITLSELTKTEFENLGDFEGY